MSGMATHPAELPDPISKESALLKCVSCGRSQRVWLERCIKCNSPETNWYEARLAVYEKRLEEQDKLIRKQADLLNRYAPRPEDEKEKEDGKENRT